MASRVCGYVFMLQACGLHKAAARGMLARNDVQRHGMQVPLASLAMPCVHTAFPYLTAKCSTTLILHLGMFCAKHDGPLKTKRGS